MNKGLITLVAGGAVLIGVSMFGLVQPTVSQNTNVPGVHFNRPVVSSSNFTGNYKDQKAKVAEVIISKENATSNNRKENIIKEVNELSDSTFNIKVTSGDKEVVSVKASNKRDKEADGMIRVNGTDYNIFTQETNGSPLFQYKEGNN